LKVTVTVRLLFKVTVHTCPVTVSQPDQLPNVDPVLGVAVSVTAVPLVKLPLHADVQLMPDGELVTVPLPTPKKATVRIGDVPPPKPGQPFTERLLTVTFI
jgi:hypothetical protein